MSDTYTTRHDAIAIAPEWKPAPDRPSVVAAFFMDDDQPGMWVEIETLPGCASQGDTFSEALANIKEALSATIKVYSERKKCIPRARQEFDGRPYRRRLIYLDELAESK